jgi:hypothetical protein
MVQEWVIQGKFTQEGLDNLWITLFFYRHTVSF